MAYADLRAFIVGGMIAVLLLKAAVACHNGMATFAEAEVSGPSANN